MTILSRGDFILEAHGNGGKLTQELISDVFSSCFKNEVLNQGLDSAIIDISGRAASNGSRLAFTTDSYVVSPLFFNGGDIGKLAVTGTINDLCVCGAIPCALSCGFIIEEGFAVADLRKIALSMAETAAAAGTSIVTGDTKVVGKGRCDGVYINTSGVGLIKSGLDLRPENIEPGDVIILSGPPGNHGMCILNERGGYVDKSSIRSDCAPLVKPITALLERGFAIKVMRDPTRGGVATTLNEFVVQNGRAGINIDEKAVLYDKGVKSLADILGLDLLYSACEGRAIIACDKKDAGGVINELKKYEETCQAHIIGCADEKNKGRVIMKTSIGGARILDMQVLEQFPRIC